MWRTMQAEPSTSVPYMAHDAVKVLIQLRMYKEEKGRRPPNGGTQHRRSQGGPWPPLNFK